jgi:hypothetical protein
MTDQDLVIELEPDDTHGHVALRVTDDDGWLKERLGRDQGARIALKTTDDDVEGHATGTAVVLRAFDDEDTEGHAIAVHFPTLQEADAFRRRLLLTGVIVGSVALGAAAGAGVASIPADTGAAGITAAGAADANRDVGLMDFSGAAAGVDASTTDAGRDVGLMDFSGAAAGVDASTTVTDADRDIGLMEAEFGGAEPETQHESDLKGPAPR